MKLFIILFCFLFSHLLNAQAFQKPYASVIGSSLGHAEAVEDLGQAALHSPAILLESKLQIAVSYRQLSAGDFGLNAFNAAFRQKVGKRQHLGLGAAYFGNEAGQLIDLNVHYGRALFEELNLGVQFNFHQRNITNYEMENSWSAELAMKSVVFDEQLELGFWARNAFPMSRNDWSLASLHLSAKFKVSPQVALYAGWVQQMDLSPDIGFGLAYQIVEAVDAKISFFSNSNTFVLGVGYRLSDEVGTHFAGRLHPLIQTQWMAGAYYEK
jgi:hypothetical protein